MTEEIKSAINAMKRSILRQKGSTECENEINDTTDQLLNEYMSALNRGMKDLEVGFSNLCNILLVCNIKFNMCDCD